MDFFKINRFVLSLIFMGLASIVKSDEISVYPTPSVKNLSVCENSPRLTGTIGAEITTSAAFTDSDFKLVWYKSNADGTMDESQEYSEIELSPSIQKAESGSKETTYKYYVLQRLTSSTTKPYEQSAPVAVTVTVNALPRLKEEETAPKCKGESQKLLEMYSVDIECCTATYYYANQGSMVTMSSDVVTESGLYVVKGWYVINRGTTDEEICESTPKDLNVVFQPYIVFDENSFQEVYEVVNGDKLAVNLEFKVPAASSDIEPNVRWIDEKTGFVQNGASVEIDPVKTNSYLHIVADNQNYCKAETDIMILVDAKLQMKAELERTDICEGESTKIIVDTTGTGKLLHPERSMLKVIETTADGDKEIILVNSGTGKLEANVSPASDAKYRVVYTYDVGNQDETRFLQLKVCDNDDVKNITVDKNELVDVYSINGVLLKSKVEYKYAFDGLDSGIYVINGEKVVYVK